MEYYVAMRKNEIWPFVATWMELESVMLSEISHTEKDRYHMVSSGRPRALFLQVPSFLELMTLDVWPVPRDIPSPKVKFIYGKFV